jgi:hypothetical protein
LLRARQGEKRGGFFLFKEMNERQQPAEPCLYCAQNERPSQRPWPSPTLKRASLLKKTRCARVVVADHSQKKTRRRAWHREEEEKTAISKEAGSLAHLAGISCFCLHLFNFGLAFDFCCSSPQSARKTGLDVGLCLTAGEWLKWNGMNGEK